MKNFDVVDTAILLGALCVFVLAFLRRKQQNKEETAAQNHIDTMEAEPNETSLTSLSFEAADPNENITEIGTEDEKQNKTDNKKDTTLNSELHLEFTPPISTAQCQSMNQDQKYLHPFPHFPSGMPTGRRLRQRPLLILDEGLKTEERHQGVCCVMYIHYVSAQWTSEPKWKSCRWDIPSIQLQTTTTNPAGSMSLPNLHKTESGNSETFIYRLPRTSSSPKFRLSVDKMSKLNLGEGKHLDDGLGKKENVKVKIDKERKRMRLAMNGKEKVFVHQKRQNAQQKGNGRDKEKGKQKKYLYYYSYVQFQNAQVEIRNLKEIRDVPAFLQASRELIQFSSPEVLRFGIGVVAKQR